MKRGWIWLTVVSSVIAVVVSVRAAVPTLAQGITATPTPTVPSEHDGHHGASGTAANDAAATPTPTASGDNMDNMHGMDHMATPMMAMDDMDMMGQADDAMDDSMGHVMVPVPSDGVPAAVQDAGASRWISGLRMALRYLS